MKNKIHCQQNSSQNRAKYMYMQSVLFQLLEKTQIPTSLNIANYRCLCHEIFASCVFLFRFFVFVCLSFFSASRSLKFKRLCTNFRQLLTIQTFILLNSLIWLALLQHEYAQIPYWYLMSRLFRRVLFSRFKLENTKKRH